MISNINAGTLPQLYQLNTLRERLDELETRLGTGKVAQTFGGLGSDRRTDLALRRQIAEIDGHTQSGKLANLFLGELQATSQRLETLRQEARKTTNITTELKLESGGKAESQTSMAIGLRSVISQLNGQIGGRYLYSGTSADRMPVRDLDTILDGTATQAGLRRVISEYWQADAGAGQNGRMAVDARDEDVTLREDGSHPFGFKIAAATSTIEKLAIAVTAGPPASRKFTFNAPPAIGSHLRVDLDMPDGSRTKLVLTAATEQNQGKGQFAIGASNEETADNLASLMDKMLTREAQTGLRAASAMRAARNFFDTAPKDPAPAGYVPQARVTPDASNSGSFASATALGDGSATTLDWYQGDNRAGDPRLDMRARIDNDRIISYGARANEARYLPLLNAMTTFVAADLSAKDANVKGFYAELSNRVNAELTPVDNHSSGPRVAQIEYSTIQKTVKDTLEQQKIQKNSVQTFIDEIENINDKEVAYKILKLNTNINSSYRATALALRLSLSNYL